MSHIRSFSDTSNDALLASGPAATASTEAIESPASKKRKAPADSRSPEPESLGRRRPASWHPSGPVEPRLAPTQLPPIAVPSILNPAYGEAPVDCGRDASGMHQMSRPRLPSSPTPRLVHPSMTHPAKRLSLSPEPKQQRPLMAPVSPSARFMGTAGGYSGKPGAAYHSPLVHESQHVSYSTPGSPQPTDPSIMSSSTAPPAGGPPPSTSVQSTPTFHSRRISAGPTPQLSPQETSPSTPQSIYSQFGRASPALTGISGPPSMPSLLHSSPYGNAETGRFPPVAAGAQRYPVEGPHSGMPNTPADSTAATQPGMIPCTLDLKSGSSTQAEKRKANSDASRRFRNRKRNEVQMEQKITAQQEEMRKQADALHQRTQEIRTLTQQCEYYRSERDYYREHLSRVVPPSQLPTRPISPQAPTSSSSTTAVEKPAADHANESVWKQNAMPATTLPAPASLPPATTMAPSRVPTTWTTAPSAYSTAPSASSVSDDQSRSLPQPSWTRA